MGTKEIKRLNNKEQRVISLKIAELKNMSQQAIACAASAYKHDWQRLDQALSQAVLEYRHILNTAECTANNQILDN